MSVPVWVAYADGSGFDQFDLMFSGAGAAVFLAIYFAAVAALFNMLGVGFASLLRVTIVSIFVVVLVAGIRPVLRLTVWSQHDRLVMLLSEAPSGEARVGLLRFVRVENRYDAYRMLVLNPNPSGPTGLVRTQACPGGAWSCLTLSGGWHLFTED